MLLVSAGAQTKAIFEATGHPVALGPATWQWRLEPALVGGPWTAAFQPTLRTAELDMGPRKALATAPPQSLS